LGCRLFAASASVAPARQDHRKWLAAAGPEIPFYRAQLYAAQLYAAQLSTALIARPAGSPALEVFGVE
jgi:hypothetical protein